MSRDDDTTKADDQAATKPKPSKKRPSSASRARKWLTDGDDSQWVEILGTTKGYRYYAIDLAMRPGRQDRLRQRLYKRGYDKCADVGDAAYSTAITRAEVWRIAESDYQILWNARQARDDAAREKMQIK